MIRAKVIGATGYGGIGIVELLLQHPGVELVSLVAREEIGRPIDEIYPHLANFCSLPVLAADDPAAQVEADVVFCATPDGVGMVQAPDILATGARLIDYSGDFRFTTPEAYHDYASRIGRNPVHASPQLLGSNVYGLTELHRDAVRTAKLVGNPGCFAVSCILGLAPAVAAGLVEPIGLICDCKTGASGAGKKLNASYHFPARYEQMNAYRLSGHQHVCEVERELGLLAGQEVRSPSPRRPFPSAAASSPRSTALTRACTEEDLLACYRDFTKISFHQSLCSQKAIGTMHVRGTNFCNLTVSVDARCNRLRIVSHIDNLMKGQAGSALQNMNTMFGLPETTGLLRPANYP